MLDLLNDLDRILATDTHFMMGVWIKDAKAQGTTEQVQKFNITFTMSHGNWKVANLLFKVGFSFVFFPDFLFGRVCFEFHKRCVELLDLDF